MVHTVRIHRDGAANAEDVGGLHRLHRPLRVDGSLDVVPRRPAFNAHHCRRLVERDAIETPHVEDECIARERMPAHAVAHAGSRHAQPVLPCKRQSVSHVVYLADFDDTADWRAVQATGVVDRAATLRPAQRAAIGEGRLGSARRRTLRFDGRTILWRRRFGRVFEGTARRINGQQRRDQENAEGKARSPARPACTAVSSHRGVQSRRRRA